MHTPRDTDAGSMSPVGRPEENQQHGQQMHNIEPLDHEQQQNNSPLGGTASQSASDAALLKSSESFEKNKTLFLIIAGVIGLLSFITMCLSAAAAANTAGIPKGGPPKGMPAGAGAPTTITNKWAQVYPVGAVPPARLAHAAATDIAAKNLYISGGLHGTTTVYGDLWKYTEATDAWTPLTQNGNVPTARLHHSLVAVDTDTLVLFGGFNVFQGQPGHDSYDDLYKLQLSTMTWTKITPAGAKPTKRGAHDCVLLVGAMYCFGGFPEISTTGHSHELWKLSLSTWTWTNLTDPAPTDATWPDGRIGFAFTEVDGKGLIAFGGCSGDDTVAGQCPDMWVLDPATNTFSELTTTNAPPARRATHGDVSIFGLTFLYGGVYIDAASPPPVMYDDLWCLDITTGVWMRLHPNYDRGTRPPKLFGHTVSRLNDKMVLFGGRVGTPASPGSNTLYELTVVKPVQ